MLQYLKWHLSVLSGICITSTASKQTMVLEGLKSQESQKMSEMTGNWDPIQSIILFCMALLLRKHLMRSDRPIGFNTYFLLTPCCTQLPAFSACRHLHRVPDSQAGHCEPAVHFRGPSAPAGICVVFVCRKKRK